MSQFKGLKHENSLETFGMKLVIGLNKFYQHRNHKNRELCWHGTPFQSRKRTKYILELSNDFP